MKNNSVYDVATNGILSNQNYQRGVPDAVARTGTSRNGSNQDHTGSENMPNKLSHWWLTNFIYKKQANNWVKDILKLNKEFNAKFPETSEPEILNAIVECLIYELPESEENLREFFKIVTPSIHNICYLSVLAPDMAFGLIDFRAQEMSIYLDKEMNKRGAPPTIGGTEKADA